MSRVKKSIITIIMAIVAILGISTISKAYYVNQNLTLIISIILSIIIYFIMIIILRTFSKSEICMIPYGSKFLKKFQKEKS